MTDKTIRNDRQVGGDYFNLIYSGTKLNTLNYYLDKFNFDDYWCLKVTRNQKLVDYDELIEFKYSGYIFFKKELYDVDKILYWINWLNNIGGINFLARPTPPFNPNKIIIIRK